MKYDKIKQALGFPLAEEYRERIERDLSIYTRKTGKLVCAIILTFQLVMIISISSKAGGPLATPRRTMYFTMYFVLAAVTALALLGVFVSRKESGKEGIKQKPPPSSGLVLGTGALYTLLVCLWSMGITLLDQLGGTGITVFSYMLMSIAALSVLKPWQSVSIFGVCFLVLSVLLLQFEAGVRDVFSNTLNGLFVTMFAILISVLSYRSRVFGYHKQIIIENQYQKIDEINQKLNHQVMVDDLTQLNNRRFFDKVIRRRLESQHKQTIIVTGMMLDIDFFKQYNDKYGHQAGDVCLQGIAKEIREFTDNEDANAVRYGGEEFFICLFGCDEAEALCRAEKLRASVEGIHLKNGVRGRHVTVSIGLCVDVFPGGADFMEFVNRSDQALYQAKRRGRNRVEIYR